MISKMEENQARDWRRFAMCCARYLTADELAAATTLAGGKAFICHDKPLAAVAPPAPPEIQTGFQEVQASRETAEISGEATEKIDALINAARDNGSLATMGTRRKLSAARSALEQHIASLETKLAAASADTKRLDDLEAMAWRGVLNIGLLDRPVIEIWQEGSAYAVEKTCHSFREAADFSLSHISAPRSHE